MRTGPQRGMTDSGTARALCVLAALLLQLDLLTNAGMPPKKKTMSGTVDARVLEGLLSHMEDKGGVAWLQRVLDTEDGAGPSDGHPRRENRGGPPVHFREEESGSGKPRQRSRGQQSPSLDEESCDSEEEVAAEPPRKQKRKEKNKESIPPAEVATKSPRKVEESSPERPGASSDSDDDEGTCVLVAVCRDTLSRNVLRRRRHQLNPRKKHKNCALSKPRNVHFRSRNMRAIVHWLPPTSCGDSMLFTVEYMRYGSDKWRRMAACTDINTTWCDLTNETYDYEEQYYARVMARLSGNRCSKWVCTERFNPITDTKIDPPTVSLSAGNRFISIKLSPPEKWKRNSKDKSLFQIFSDVEFKVSIINMKNKRKWNLSDNNSSLNVTKLDTNSTYCVTVETYIPRLYETTQPSQRVCVTTLEDNNEEVTIKILFGFVLPIVIAILLCSAVGYSVYRYIHVDGVKRPKNLLKLPIDGSHGKVLTPEINIFCSFNFVNGSNAPWNCHTSDTTHSGSTTGKKQEEECPQMQEPGYCPRGQEMFHGRQSNPPYNKQSQCLNGLLVTEVTSLQGLLAENYGRVQYVSVEGKEDQLPAEKVPVEEAYKPQTTCMLGEASAPLLSLQLIPMSSGKSELQIYDSPLVVTGYRQRQTDSHVIEVCSTTVLDWDCTTGRLNIPSLLDLRSEADTEERQSCDLWDQHSGEGLLAKLKQTLQKVVEDDEEEVCLSQFKGKWDLHVQMN